MGNVVFTAFSLLASFLVLVPLPWQLEAWNVGTCLYMLWASLSCFNYGVNSIIWRSDAINRAPVWCDISSRIIVATAVALPASALCILRRLHQIITAQTLSTRTSRRKDIALDLSIGVGLPMIQIVMQYVVSGHRFDIFEEVGCYPFTYNTPLAYPLSISWPIVIGLISALYCALILRGLMRRRAQLAEFLSSTSSLTAQRYLRLMAIAITEMMCTVPIASYGMYLNLARFKLQPWISWNDTHYHYSKVVLYPSTLWQQDHIAVLTIGLSRWLSVACALIFFLFFGLGEEARKHYIEILLSVSSFLRLRSRPIRGSLPFSYRVPVNDAFLRRPSPARKASSLFMSSIGSEETAHDSFEVPLFSIKATPQRALSLSSASSVSTLMANGWPAIELDRGCSTSAPELTGCAAPPTYKVKADWRVGLDWAYEPFATDASLNGESTVPIDAHNE